MAVKPRQCERCQAMISAGRLEALPRTRICVKCSRETGGDLRLRVSTKRTGKAGSLKRTGTDIDSVEWVRREVRPLAE